MGNKERAKSTRGQSILILILVSLAVEILVFNIRSLQSMFYKEYVVPAENIRMDGFDDYGNGIYVLSDGAEEGVVYVTGLDQFGVAVHNIHLEWELPLAEDHYWSESGICTITPFLRDEGHDRYTQLADHIFREDILPSGYLWFQGNGSIRTIVLKMSFSEPGAIAIGQIVMNAHQPLQVLPIRMLVVFLVLFGLMELCKAFREPEDNKTSSIKKEAVIALIIGLVLIVPSVVLTGFDEYKKEDRHFQPYQMLAEAFGTGQVHLLAEPEEAIRSMENPYDYTARTDLGLEEGVDYLWDTAYYNGHYYVYFGIVPCLLFYLPVWLLLRVHMTESIVMAICAALFYIGLWFTVRSICNRYHKNIPYYLQILAVMTVFLGSNMQACLGNPDAHDIPRICGIAFLVWGFYFWISAIPKESGMIRLKRVAGGSLCMALAVGCRPNLALYSMIAPVLFWQYRKEQEGEARQALYRRYIALFLPYIPVAIGLMYYNLIRFGSVFDFGFAYNLTMQDCSRTVLSMDKLFLGIYGYLFKMPQMDYRFPYLVTDAFAELNRYGHTTVYYTYCYGGLLICNLFTWCIPVLFEKEHRKKPGAMLGIALLSTAMIQLLVNALTGGISYNYMADFAFPLLIASWIAVFVGWQELRGTVALKYYKGFVTLALVWSVWFHIQFVFQSTLNVGNTELYYRIFYAFNFF